MHFGDDWKIVQNQIENALKPLSDKVFTNLDEGLKTFMEDMEEGQGITQSFADSLNGWGMAFLALINPAIGAITALQHFWPDTAGVVPPVGPDVIQRGAPVTPGIIFGSPTGPQTQQPTSYQQQLDATAARAQAPDQQVPRYDLLLKGGHVIDPANGIDAKMDVGISSGHIAAVEKEEKAARGVTLVRP